MWWSLNDPAITDGMGRETHHKAGKAEGIGMGAFVTFEKVNKIYRTGEVEIQALKNVNFEIGQGEFCVIVGASGGRAGGLRIS